MAAENSARMAVSSGMVYFRLLRAMKIFSWN